MEDQDQPSALELYQRARERLDEVMEPRDPVVFHERHFAVDMNFTEEDTQGMARAMEEANRLNGLAITSISTDEEAQAGLIEHVGRQIMDLAVEQANAIARVTGINDVGMINRFVPGPADPENRGKPPSTTHLINAERLLAEVLPKELYIELNATLKFTILSKLTKAICVTSLYSLSDRLIPLKYELSRRYKTHIHCSDGSIYAACIAPDSHGPVPEADRLVAEYLLLVNDERKYLETANLSLVRTGGEVPVVRPPGYRPIEIDPAYRARRQQRLEQQRAQEQPPATLRDRNP